MIFHPGFPHGGFGLLLPLRCSPPAAFGSVPQPGVRVTQTQAEVRA
jgi:hypothetical protein